MSVIFSILAVAGFFLAIGSLIATGICIRELVEVRKTQDAWDLELHQRNQPGDEHLETLRRGVSEDPPAPQPYTPTTASPRQFGNVMPPKNQSSG